MIYIIWFCIILLIFTITKSLIRLIESSHFLHSDYNLDSTKKRKIMVLIPAMNEEKNVSSAISYFKELSDV